MPSLAGSLSPGKTTSLNYLNEFAGLTPRQRREALDGGITFGRYIDAVFFQCYGPIYRSVMAKDRAQREEHLHDLIVKLSEKPDYKLPEYGQDVYAWVLTVVRNAQRDEHRQRGNRRRILIQHFDEMNHRLLQGAQDMSRDPADLVCGRTVAWIEELPEGQAEVARLMLDGYSQAETAARLGISQQAVSKRLSKIRANNDLDRRVEGGLNRPKRKPRRNAPSSGFECCGKRACPQHQQVYEYELRHL